MGQQPVTIDRVEGAILVDQIKSFDWTAMKIAFKSKADHHLLYRVRAYLAVLLAIK